MSPAIEPAFGVGLEPPYFVGNHWVSPFNYAPEVRDSWVIPEKIEIHDVTLRDGEQTARVVFTPEEKIHLALELDALGVASIESGLLVTKEDREVATTLTKMRLRAKVKPLVRVRKEDVEHALECGVPAIVLEFTINPYLLKYCYDTTPKELARQIIEFSNTLKAAGIAVEFMGWDTFRIPSLEYLHEFFREILDKGSIDRLTISDTFGMAHPSAVAFMFRKLRSFFPGLPLGFHIHNDFGMATASALVALTSGASSVHSTVNGLGERAGNAATEEVAVGLQHLLGVDAGIKLDRLNRVARIFAEASKRPLPPNKPIVGSALFEVESGIVVHILKRLRESELGEAGFSPYPPEKVGQTPYTVIAGRGTGHHAVHVLLDSMELSATEDQVAELVDRVKQLSLVLKNGLPDQLFRDLALQVVNQGPQLKSRWRAEC